MNFFTDGIVALKNVITLSEISGAPAGTIYKEDNFLKNVYEKSSPRKAVSNASAITRCPMSAG